MSGLWLRVVAGLAVLSAPSSVAAQLAHIDTELGTIELELQPEACPIAVNRFVRVADSGGYEGTRFHRAIPGYLLQGGEGAPTSSRRLPLETAGRRHVRGAVAMVRDIRGDGGSDGGEFFIVLGEAPLLDEIEFSIFARVIDGLAVADRIAVQPRDDSNHDLLRHPIAIRGVRIVRDGEVPSGPDPEPGSSATPTPVADGPVVKPSPSSAATPPRAAEAPVARRVRVVVDRVNVRGGPGLDHPVLARLGAGTELRVIGVTENWYNVALDEGRDGWLRDDMIQSAPDAKPGESSR